MFIVAEGFKGARFLKPKRNYCHPQITQIFKIFFNLRNLRIKFFKSNICYSQTNPL